MTIEVKISFDIGEFITDSQRVVVTRKVEEISAYLEKVIKWNKGGFDETQKQKKKR